MVRQSAVPTRTPCNVDSQPATSCDLGRLLQAVLTKVRVGRQLPHRHLILGLWQKELLPFMF